jgi:hypothetical protein
MKKLSVKKLCVMLLIPVLGFLPAGCDLSGTDESEILFEYDFRSNETTWESFFTDYNVGWEEDMELTSDYRPLPEPLDTTDNAHYISAVNHSDDVKMLFRNQVEGLLPNTIYQVGFSVHFATSVPSGCAGIGGAPGEAVRVLADASDIRPEPVTGGTDNDYYLLNIQHIDDDPAGWYDGVLIGDIANSRACEDGYEYEIKEINTGPDHSTVTTDESGRAWLLFGTRSGFEGRTELYYTNVRATFRR